MIAVVLTPNGTHHFISNQTASDLYQAGNDDLVELDDGTKITPKMAGEIIPIEEYYKQFPQKRPEQRVPNIKDIPGISWNDMAAGNFPGYSDVRRKLARDGIAKGLERFIDKQKKLGIPTPKAQAILDQVKSGARKSSYATNARSYSAFLDETGKPNTQETWKEFGLMAGISN